MRRRGISALLCVLITLAPAGGQTPIETSDLLTFTNNLRAALRANDLPRAAALSTVLKETLRVARNRSLAARIDEEIDAVLGWLSPDTETLMVARGTRYSRFPPGDRQCSSAQRAAACPGLHAAAVDGAGPRRTERPDGRPHAAPRRPGYPPVSESRSGSGPAANAGPDRVAGMRCLRLAAADGRAAVFARSGRSAVRLRNLEREGGQCGARLRAVPRNIVRHAAEARSGGSLQ